MRLGIALSPRALARVNATAASLVVLAVSAIGGCATGREPWQRYWTAIGGRQEIALESGSTVTLNTNTELHTRIRQGRREVELVQGEALFYLTPGVSPPAVVTANGIVVRTDGGGFSVRIHAPQVTSVLVTAGQVTLAGQTGGEPKPTALSAGEVGTVRGAQLTVATVGKPEASRQLAWTEGRIEFDGSPLKEVVAEFNRYNLRHLVIVDPSVERARMGGKFYATDLSSFVNALQGSGFVTEDGTGPSGSPITRVRGRGNP